MTVSYLRPLPKPEAANDEVAEPRLEWQVILITVAAVVTFYFFAIGFWTVVGPHLHPSHILN